MSLHQDLLPLPRQCPDPVEGTPPPEVRTFDNLRALAGVQLFVGETIYLEDTGESHRVVEGGPGHTQRTWYLRFVSRRPGDFIWTASGRKFWPLDPRPEDVPIEDMAHALAHICRWTGHVVNFFSVAQHSVFVSSLIRRPPFLPQALEGALRLYALLHDGSEAFLNDIARPLKRLPYMRGYVEVEEHVQQVIYRLHGVAHLDDMEPVAKALRAADYLALAIEARDLMPKSIRGTLAYERIMQPLAEADFSDQEINWQQECLVALGPDRAKAEFLEAFKSLGGRIEGV